MNKKIRKMLRTIERRGGIVHMNPALPDDVAEQFLEQMLACPDCCGADPDRLDTQRPPIDQVIAGRGPKRFTGH